LSPLEDRSLAVWGKVVVTVSPEVLLVAAAEKKIIHPNLIVAVMMIELVKNAFHWRMR
jgi:hypothetical protein